MIYCASLKKYLSWLLVLALLASAASAAKRKPTKPEELINLFLGLEYSKWLVGPIVRMADAEEVEAYLGLRQDSEAESFVRAFWQRRDPDPGEPGNPVLELFEERAIEADKLYTEATFLGRRTDRGTVYILYGPPEESRYEEGRDVRQPPVELWEYPKKAPKGLDGERPARYYRFFKPDGVTVFYSQTPVNPRDRVREPQPPFGGLEQ